MTDLVLAPALAARAGLALGEAGRALAAAGAGAGGEIGVASTGPPWGADEIGAAFERNYRPIETALLAVWSAVASSMEGLGDGVTAAVAATVETDALAAGRLGGRA